MTMISKLTYKLQGLIIKHYVWKVCPDNPRSTCWVEFQVAIKTGYAYNSACRQDGSEILTAMSMFSGSSYPMRSTGMLYDQTGSGKFNKAASK